MLYVGVDPGTKGAAYAIHSTGQLHSSLRFQHHVVDGGVGLALCEYLQQLQHPVVVAIEKVHSMPRQGVASTFKFGQLYGEALAACAIAKVPLLQVAPQRWQRALQLLSRDKTETQAHHKARLRQQAVLRWAATVRADESDALWIAEWCRLHGHAPAREV